MSERKKVVVSFDLDFTLINNKKGIVNSFNYALGKFGLPEVDKTIIQNMIGIPLNDMFTRFTEKDPSRLSFAFREYYATKGIYESKLLSGVMNKLKQLKLHNFTLGIITSKKQSIAVKIARYLKIDGFFDYILGETEFIRSKLDSNLIQFLSEKYPRSTIIIVGDHPKDALLAKSLDCPFIGVLSGFHTAYQLIHARENEIQTLIVKNVKKITIDMIYSMV
ncbi:MAG: HAD family hydrolase [Candidatus Thorarchaeota archaeon]